MHSKSLQTLEFFKVLARLAEHTSFSAGRELAEALRPASDPAVVTRALRETREALHLLEVRAGVQFGGAHDVRPQVGHARIGATLQPQDLLDIRDTLARARALRRTLLRLGADAPRLAEIASRLLEESHAADEIARAINDRGEVIDSASPALLRIRRELNTGRARLIDRLQKMIASSEYAKYLQEPLITQRSGRYVLPLKADFKGRVQGIVHDSSASGQTLFVEPLATVELNNTLRELELQEQKEVERILIELTGCVAAEADRIVWTVESLADLDLAFAKARYAEALRATEPTIEANSLSPTRSAHLGEVERVGAAPSRPESPLGSAVGPASPEGPKESPLGSAVRLASPEGPKESPLGSAVRPASPEGPKGGRKESLQLNLLNARHPLLNQETVVPISLALGEGAQILIITGPNTGGKTVTLKTVGLLALMAQAGMFVPAADGTTLPIFEDVYADIGDEQSIEQSLSTFSSHMRNVIEFLRDAGPRSLVLMDELGAGTDPVEGSALAQAILENLRERRIMALVATHYTELKLYAHSTAGVQNASVEFDLETLMPTYRLTVGLPGRSNALAIASRLGLSPQIVAAARARVSGEHLQADELLADLKRAQQAAEADAAAALLARAEAERKERELRGRLSQIEEERRQAVNAARREAEQGIEQVRTELAEVRGRIRSAAAEAELQNEKRRLDELSAQVEPLEPPARSSAQRTAGTLAVGDKVWVPSLNQRGRVIALNNSEAEVQVGNLRLKLRAVQLEKDARSETQPPPAQTTVRVTSPTPDVASEIHLRGLRVDDALMTLEKYLDDAYLAQLPRVRIVHGKGTGALRQAVREMLEHHPLVAGFRPGDRYEGEEGVTILEMVSR
jgi:DNA mismatch repair protein MutS2